MTLMSASISANHRTLLLGGFLFGAINVSVNTLVPIICPFQNWCRYKESNLELMLTRQLLYRLTIPAVKVVELEGIEPTTFWMQTRRSPN